MLGEVSRAAVPKERTRMHPEIQFSFETEHLASENSFRFLLRNFPQPAK
jgi:hypothetical protein